MKSFIFAVVAVFATLSLVSVVECNEEHLKNLNATVERIRQECEDEKPVDLSTNDVHCSKLCVSQKLGIINNNGKFDPEKFIEVFKPDLFVHDSIPDWKKHIRSCDKVNSYESACEVEHHLALCFLEFDHPSLRKPEEPEVIQIEDQA